MNVLIIEDEAPAAKRLVGLLSTIEAGVNILAILDSIEEASNWLSAMSHPDLIFMDIMLADGQCFEIFEKVRIDSPVIFTTAYDEYAIRAFKVNSIDYLLKPIEPELLQGAIGKYRQLSTAAEHSNAILRSLGEINRTLTNNGVSYKKRFLAKIGDKFIPIETDEIQYVSFEDKNTYINTTDDRKIIIDYSLDEMERLLDPSLFFRLNRQYLTSFAAIKSVHAFFNAKLRVYLAGVASTIVVSRERANSLKNWLNR